MRTIEFSILLAGWRYKHHFSNQGATAACELGYDLNDDDVSC